MKKLFYLSLLFVVNIVMSLPLVAQEDYSYVPLLTEGKSWLWVSQNDHFPTRTYYFKVEVVGDTVVDGRVGKRMRQWYPYETDIDEYFFAAFEEDKRIYYLYENSGEIVLLLDFNLKKGDTSDGWDSETGEKYEDYLTVENEEIIDTPAGKRRKLKLNYGSYWVEGIGSNNSDWITVFPMPIGNYLLMLECYEDGKCIFTQSDFGGTNGIDEIKDGGTSRPDYLIDIMGRRVTNPRKGNIYITPTGEKIIFN